MATEGCGSNSQPSMIATRSELAICKSTATRPEQIRAEGMGFESMRPLARPSNFQDCRLRPLGHPSNIKARPPKEAHRESSAEGEGFEPSRSCPLRHCECRALGQPMRSLQEVAGYAVDQYFGTQYLVLST